MRPIIRLRCSHCSKSDVKTARNKMWPWFLARDNSSICSKVRRRQSRKSFVLLINSDVVLPAQYCYMFQHCRKTDTKMKFRRSPPFPLWVYVCRMCLRLANDANSIDEMIVLQPVTGICISVCNISNTSTRRRRFQKHYIGLCAFSRTCGVYAVIHTEVFLPAAPGGGLMWSSEAANNFYWLHSTCHVIDAHVERGIEKWPAVISGCSAYRTKMNKTWINNRFNSNWHYFHYALY